MQTMKNKECSKQEQKKSKSKRRHGEIDGNKRPENMNIRRNIPNINGSHRKILFPELCFQWKRKFPRANRLALALARMTRIRSWSFIWVIFQDCAGYALAIDASNNRIFKIFILEVCKSYKCAITFDCYGKINRLK